MRASGKWAAALSEGGALLAWWRGQLHQMALLILAHVLPALVTRLQVFPGDSAWPIWLIRGARRQSLASVSTQVIAAGSAPEALRPYLKSSAILGLSRDHLLSLEPRFPAAIAGSLQSAVALYLQRELPLLPQQYYADWQIVARDREADQISVRIWVARARDVERDLATANGLGLRVVQLGVDFGHGVIEHDFLKARVRRERVAGRASARTLGACAAGLAMTLLLLTGAQWLYERLHVGKLERALGTQAALVQARFDLVTAAWRPAAALQKIIAGPDATDALLALTQAVPTDTWVYDANIEVSPEGPGHIKIMGFAPRAGQLTQSLENSPQYQAVTLLNSLPDGSGGVRERFQIAADWSRSGSPNLATVARAGLATDGLVARP